MLTGSYNICHLIVIGCLLLGSGGTQICALVPRPKRKTWVQPTCQCRRHKRCGFWSLAWEGPLKKKMATDSRILAWRIPWTEEPVRLQSIGLQRVRHDWSDLAHVHPYFSKLVLYIGILILTLIKPTSRCFASRIAAYPKKNNSVTKNNFNPKSLIAFS